PPPAWAPARRRPGRRPGGARGPAPRHGGRAGGQGVRAPAHAGRRADPRLHEGAAAARGLGLPHARQHPDARLPRLPPAPQARPGRRSLRGQRVGDRVPPRRRPGRGGSVLTPARLAAALGWAAALVLCALQLRARRRLARACHEVRGPLCAARLGLGTLEADPPRLAAIDLELRRAAPPLDALAGPRVPDRRELVDLCALARAHAPAWQAVAASHGAGLRLDVVAEAPPPGGIIVPLRPRRRPRCTSAGFATAAASSRG